MDSFVTGAFLDQIELLKNRGNTLEMKYLERLTIDELKALWDSYDGAETSDPDISGEAVYCSLCLRGEGDYCEI